MTLLLTKNLDVAIAEKIICTGLELQIQPGQSWGILGSNGCGKTTLLHTLAGLYPGYQGEILLNGQSLQRLTRRDIARQVGVLLQHYEDSFPATVLETVLIGRQPHLSFWCTETNIDRQLASHALQQMDLEFLHDRSVTSLSGGERRRLAIATVLCQTPKLYLLDEPTNHLDLKHQHRVLQHFQVLIKEQDAAVVMVLHDVNLAARYCDHVVLLDGVGGCSAGPASVLLEKTRLSQLYQHSLFEIITPLGSFWISE